MTEAATLHIQMASTWFPESDKKFMLDEEIILKRDADVVVHTEINKRHNLLLEAGREFGYQLFDPRPGSDIVFMLKKGIQCSGVGSELVTPGHKGPAMHGGHGPRAVEWLDFVFAGNQISLAGAHWTTGYGRSEERRKQGIAMWEAMGRHVNAAGHGKRLAFWAGDVNWDEDDHSDNLPNKLMDNADMTTVFEELGKKNLGTHGKRQIDVIGSYDRDQRVKADHVKVWPDQTFIDHQQVSAWYTIQPLHKG